MPDQTDNERFRELLGCLLDDEIGKDQMRELTAMVKASPEFMRDLQTQLFMDSGLAQYENEGRRASAFEHALEAALDAEEDGGEFVNRVVEMADAFPGRESARKAPWIVAVTALAAGLVIGFFLIVRGPEGATAEPMDSGVAVVSSLVGELRFDGMELEAGDTVPPGVLRLDDGYVALEFYRGAQVTVGGPAKLELIDSQRVICHEGKVRAIVPAVAKGFTIVTPDSEVVDLGTEFAVKVGRMGDTEIHVFDGEVEAYDAARSPGSKKLLKAGRGMKIRGAGDWEQIEAESSRFEDLVDLEGLQSDADAKRFEDWSAVREAGAKDGRLIAYYDFEPDPKRRRLLRNRAMTGRSLDGAIVGAKWVDGPWPGKSALGFKRPSDRIRVELPGEYESVTFAAWVRVDGIDRTHSSLLLTDGYDAGELHWQFRQGGNLILGARHSAKSGTNYMSGKFIDLTRLGRWFHLATVIDSVDGKVSHYLDGKLLTVKEMKGGGPFRLGGASIGNWDRPVEDSGSAIRNLNGRLAEMMVFGSALPAAEIERLALQSP